jgi:hypothetical protein
MKVFQMVLVAYRGGWILAGRQFRRISNTRLEELLSSVQQFLFRYLNALMIERMAPLDESHYFQLGAKCPGVPDSKLQCLPGRIRAIVTYQNIHLCFT